MSFSQVSEGGLQLGVDHIDQRFFQARRVSDRGFTFRDLFVTHLNDAVLLEVCAVLAAAGDPAAITHAAMGGDVCGYQGRHDTAGHRCAAVLWQAFVHARDSAHDVFLMPAWTLHGVDRHYCFTSLDTSLVAASVAASASLALLLMLATSILTAAASSSFHWSNISWFCC